MKPKIIELDDFRTDNKLIEDIRRLQRDCGVRVRLFVLLGLCNPKFLRDVSSEFETYLHGWDHFSEKAWDYWEMRHFLEYAKYLNFHEIFYKPPWNRFPNLGVVSAMKEKECVLVTPKKQQVLLARLLRLGVSYSVNPVIHPIDFLCYEGLLERFNG